MEIEKILPEIIQKNDKKLLLVVLDGLGGLPDPNTGLTELETAKIPNLHSFAKRGTCGLTIPVFHGVTPGSGPAHLSLFGYDPVEHQIGRGVLESLGIGRHLNREDLAIRGNFATIDEKRIVTDRRAGRISTEENQRLVSLISENIKEIKGIEISIWTVKEHRCAVILKGKDLSPLITENDPEKEGLPIEKTEPLSNEGKFTAGVLEEFIKQVEYLLKKHETKAKTILLRGFSKIPQIRTFEEKYLLKSVCIASYPMYKGLSKLVGMDVIEGLETFHDRINALMDYYKNYDFFYFHYKKTDSAGEDGNFEKKVSFLEDFDEKLPEILKLKFEAIAIAGDHSTPSVLKGHSWHPVPISIVSPNIMPDDVEKFTERTCGKGLMGTFPAINVMYILLAASLKMKKFGA
ncbi:MAG: 2,3-bisphosphoglycerate-independent phosphoglycerate mutase [Candidatus Omnitrophica bacterium]|nr:2,3-bisphosphoglycerate-independent phosphoglycerate mutase [Candidatus Omnitrophota bacterium]